MSDRTPDQQSTSPEWVRDLVRRSEAAERLVSYILDGQVKRLDRDVLRNLADAVRTCPHE
jgi:hypothetical protein